MGWDFGPEDKKELVAKLVSTTKRIDANGNEMGLEVRTIKHRVVGNHLWAVQETNSVNPQRFIYLALLGKSNGRWGYKDMTEAMGPHHHDCPLAFLAMCEAPNEYGTAWRERVRSHHAAKARQKALKAQLEVGATVRFKKGFKAGGVALTTGSIVTKEKSKVVAYVPGVGLVRVTPRCIDGVE